MTGVEIAIGEAVLVRTPHALADERLGGMELPERLVERLPRDFSSDY